MNRYCPLARNAIGVELLDAIGVYINNIDIAGGVGGDVLGSLIFHRKYQYLTHAQAHQ